ncbi:MAG: hypothetical protein WAX89_06595 [Alphaproteobacteria bacterium]
MTTETTQQKMERLIEAYRRGEPVADELRTMPKDELKQLKGMLEGEKKKTSEEIGITRQKIRVEKAKLIVLNTDHKRLTKEIEMLNHQLWSAFGEIYANPQNAIQAAWDYEQAHGVAETDTAIKTRPARFGRLKGWNLLLWQSAERKQAIEWLRVFSYGRLRQKYGEAHYAKTALDNVLKGAEE